MGVASCFVQKLGAIILPEPWRLVAEGEEHGVRAAVTLLFVIEFLLEA